MDKALLSICIPSINTVYDAFVPVYIPISELTSIIAAGVSDITNGKYEPSKLEMLSLKEPEYLLNPQLTLKDYGVADGMQLYLL